MSNEFRCFGPPGTGKTTWLSRQITRALWKYEADDIVACSFTRAAAVELAGRRTGLPKSNVGTIHALCYHALDRPPLVDGDNELITLWNNHYPDWAIPVQRLEGDAPVKANSAYHIWSKERATFAKVQANPDFVEAWESFKTEHDCLDFTDLLLNAPEDIGARVLFVDEAQDLTPLQFQIVRRWGDNADYFVLAGDDDQCIYSWMGASPDQLLLPLEEDHIRTLSHSYRLPEAVAEYAKRFVSRISNRREKHYAPREGERGSVEERDFAFRNPYAILDDLEPGKTTMLLATCGYMLLPLIEELRNRGIPFHNPYRRTRGDWNPLGRGKTAYALASFVRCGEALRKDDRSVLADTERWKAWTKILNARGTLTRGAKTFFENLKRPITSQDLAEQFKSETLYALSHCDLDWLQQNALARNQRLLDYPTRIYRRAGLGALDEPPWVIVGTIHSVKGGEADTVYVSPTLSYEAHKGLLHGESEHIDALTRQIYVGITRAQRRLVLCGDDVATSPRIPWHAD